MSESSKSSASFPRPALSIISGLAALSALLISLRYPESDPDLRCLGGFISAALGHYLIFFLLTLTLARGAARLCRLPPGLEAILMTLFLGMTFVFLLADTFVYQQYHFHINLAMLDLFFNSNGEVISFGAGDTAAIIVMSILCLTVASLITIAGIYAGAGTLRICRKGIWIVIALFAGFNGINVYESAVGKNIYTAYNSAILGFHPLTMNRLLNKIGVVSLKENSYHASITKSSFRYPLNPLICPESAGKESEVRERRLDVIIIMIDTLRADTVSPEAMPFIWNFAREKISFQNHYSGGNCTRIGVFTFFYGIPGSYWNEALQGQTPPVLLSAYRNAGYRVQAYTSANLYNPEFYRTVFAGIPDLRTESAGKTPYERDASAVKDFMSDITIELDLNRQKSGAAQPSVSFIFLDQLHSITLENKDLRNQPFPTTWTEPNYTSLSRNTDPENFFNLYRNVAHETDARVGEILAFLKEKGLYDRSIIIISADHGSEFNDTGLNFWGHNSNFTGYQLKVPLMIRWPGKKPREISALTTHYDISATLLQEQLNCQNPVTDYSVGKSLFAEGNPDWFIAGSYSENAIVSRDQIALIDSIGKLSFKTPEWRSLPEDHVRNKDRIIQAINLMTKYYNNNSSYSHQK
ncbi:MAG: sulfatase-like hydrolase/transferase [Succinimonas sp.]|nr:sulfatase-like hydrolase/transferase [Succinimonas sp.]